MLSETQLRTLATTMTVTQLDALVRTLIDHDYGLAHALIDRAIAAHPISDANPPRRMPR